MKYLIVLMLMASPASAALVLKWDRKPADPVQEKLEDIDSRLSAVERTSTGPVTFIIADKPIVPLSRRTLAVLDRKLKPMMLEHAAKINSGLYKQEDIAFIVAGYNTYRDRKSLLSFCTEMLSGKYDLGGEGMRLWLMKECGE